MFEQVCFENGPTEILMQASVSQPLGIGWDVGEGQGWERGILEDLVTGEICHLERMGPKDCTPKQVPDRKGVQSLKHNYSGK